MNISEHSADPTKQFDQILYSQILARLDCDKTMEGHTYSTLDESTSESIYDSYTTGVKAKRYIVSTTPTLRVINACIGSVGLIGNLFVLLVLNLTSMRKKRTNIYLMNQSTIDGLGALFLLLSTWVEDDGRYYDTAADEVFCRVWVSKTPLWSMLTASSYNLVALTIERYLSIVYPIWHKVKFTTTMVRASIGLVWLFGICTVLVVHFPASRINADGSCTVYRWTDPVAGSIVGLMVATFIFFAPLAIFIFCYSRMARVLLVVRVAPAPNVTPSGAGPLTAKRHEDNQARSTVKPTDTAANVCGQAVTVSATRSSSSTAATTAINQPSINATARKNIFKTLVMVALAYCVCWVLNMSYYTLSNLGLPYPYIDFTSDFYNFTVVMVFCNCCINPLIYSAKYEQFQKAAKSLFCKTPAQTEATISGYTVSRTW